jgi:hypothetical protein
MKKKLFSIFLLVTALKALSQQPEFEWAIQCGNPPNTTDTKTVLASGAGGEFYLAGEFLDTTEFGGKMLISSGGTDIFLAKYTSDGVPIWANKIGAADYDYVQKVITDSDGNVIIAGYFYGDTQIGSDHYTSYGSQDIFLAKFSPEGAFLWSFRAGGQSADYVTGLALDADQNLVIAGYYYNAIVFDDSTLIAAGSSDIFLAKFSADGDLIWTSTAGGSSSDQCRSACCDPEGNVLLSGSFYYDITLGDTTLSTLNPVGVVIARYLPDGQIDRAFQLDGTYLSTENYVAADQEGGFYLTGNFSELIHFGCHSFDAGEFNQDIYIAKYGINCENLWARQAYSHASDQVMGISVDQDNFVYITGHYLDTIQFEQLTLPYTLCCGSREIFIVKYNASGGVLWGQQISGARASIQSMTLNSQDELLLSGLFSEDVILGNLTLSNFDGFHNYVSSLQTEVFTFIEQTLNISKLKVFPNPVRDELHIMYPAQNSLVNYAVYSATGTQVIAGTIRSGEGIDVRRLPAGEYLLQIVDPQGSIARNCFFIRQ